ncbi:MAG: tetratricopeptide repeat protein [Lachnospiraceae bacterium]|nr:tetratricopeptide repeat protein [Lachnospiraceae bacterium]
MVCYQCGVRLSEHDFCTGCGADVALFKKLLSTSNRLYNEGLERAGVRDLAGAVYILKQSLKYNKANIKARNLLGLCYFEMGEAVSALSEWVISKNIRPTKNIADDYISMIQTNQTRLDTINQTIKKYNQALAYCHQDSRDLAIIQLKKVLSYNPKYVRAHQLLALLYIGEEQWSLAKNELLKCNEIDANNTITLRYLKEISRMMMPEDVVKGSHKHKNNDDSIRYQSGNETIIQPAKSRDFKIMSILFNFGIGISIGIAITVSLIMPGRLKQAQSDKANELRIMSEQMDQKTASIAELEQNLKKMSEELNGYQRELDEYRNAPISTEAGDNLLFAAAVLINDSPQGGEDEITPIERIAAYLDVITQDELLEATSAFKALYESIIEVAGKELGDLCYDTGYDFYRNEEFASAIPHLFRAYLYDPENGEALWNLANAYEKNGDIDKAKEAYAQVIENFPNTDKARRSETKLVEINIVGS